MKKIELPYIEGYDQETVGLIRVGFGVTNSYIKSIDDLIKLDDKLNQKIQKEFIVFINNKPSKDDLEFLLEKGEEFRIEIFKALQKLNDEALNKINEETKSKPDKASS